MNLPGLCKFFPLIRYFNLTCSYDILVPRDILSYPAKWFICIHRCPFTTILFTDRQYRLFKTKRSVMADGQ